MADLESILQESLLNISKKLKYEPAETSIKAISSGGANYTSELFEATISAPGKQDVNVFAKVAVIGEQMRAITSANIFKIEIYCYKNLLKKYQDMERKYNIPQEHRLASPEFYEANDEYLKETVVLENLKIKGFEAFDRFKTIDWKYASESIKQLAIFHALSLALSKYDPEEFEKTKLLLKADFQFESIIGMMKNLMNNALEVVKEENKERLSAFIDSRVKVDDFDEYLKPVRCSMIIHGDYRPSNLMHKINEDGTLKVIPLDYQTARHGSPLVDLFYFIYTGSDKKFRDEHFKSTIELYYTELCNALRRMEVDPNEVYSREDFDYEYKKLLPLGLLLSLITLFIVTVEAENAPKYDKDFSLNDFVMKPNDLYKERINDIIEDFIKMGIL